jgi:DNA recombination protein Rad52
MNQFNAWQDKLDSEKVTNALNAKLDPSVVATRKQSNVMLSYVKGWYVIKKANEIFGFDGWDMETIDINVINDVLQKDETKYGSVDRWHVTYTAKVRVNVNSVIREGFGAGHGIDKDRGIAHESASKEAETDAMKRALRTFGNVFGLALYDTTQSEVAKSEADLISSNPDEFAKYAMQLVNDGRLSLVGIDVLCKLSGVKSIEEVPINFSKVFIEKINSDQGEAFLKVLSEGKNPKDGRQIIQPELPEQDTKQLENEVNQAFTK